MTNEAVRVMVAPLQETAEKVATVWALQDLGPGRLRAGASLVMFEVPQPTELEDPACDASHPW